LAEEGPDWGTEYCNAEISSPEKAKLPCSISRKGPRNISDVEVEEFP
jgi:hypothetical protein